MTTYILDGDIVVPEDKAELVFLLNAPDKTRIVSYFSNLFECLGGGSIPLEALELCFGRNNLKLRDQVMHVMCMMSSYFDEGDCESVLAYFQAKKMLHILSECSLGYRALRIISIKPKNDNLTNFTNNLYYHCLNMLHYLSDERYVDNPERIRNFKAVQKYDAMAQIVQFLDPKFATPLTMCQASAILKQFVTDSKIACDLIFKSGGFRRCLYVITRKQMEKLFMDHYTETYVKKTRYNKEEGDILESYYRGRQCILKKTERFPVLTEFDRKRESMMFMAHDVQSNCSIVVYKLLSVNWQLRREMFTDKYFMKIINKWFSTPCIWRIERSMYHFCFNFIRAIMEDCDSFISSQELIKHYNIMERIEAQIYSPDKDVLCSALNILGVFARQYPEISKKIAENPSLTKAVGIYIGSYDVQIQIGAIQVFCTFAQHPCSAVTAIRGLGMTAERMHLLESYNLAHITEVFKRVRVQLKQNCPKEWRQSTQAFRRVNVSEKYSLELALKHKEMGNVHFKIHKYKEALKCYTLGLECLPPVEHFNNKERISRRESNWYALPSVLYSNRAQCYLSMEKWDEAIFDCCAAVARSLEEENDEASKMLCKTVLRRARAFIAIEDYRNALIDVSFCLEQNLSARNVRTLFRQVLTEYRKRFGIESMRRCGACMGGLGTKLKRCAKCPEAYCSKECQAYSWNEGHKNFCNYTLDEDKSG